MPLKHYDKNSTFLRRGCTLTSFLTYSVDILLISCRILFVSLWKSYVVAVDRILLLWIRKGALNVMPMLSFSVHRGEIELSPLKRLFFCHSYALFGNYPQKIVLLMIIIILYILTY